MTWEMLASGFGLVEGPTIDTDGSLVFSDVLDGGVHRLAADGSISVVVPKRKGIGGIKRHAAGGFIIGGRDLQHARDGQTATVFALVDAMGFNDFGTDSAGRIYAGSVRWDSLNPAAEHKPGELWRVDLDGSQATDYAAQRRHLTSICVDVCNENGWVIPLAQMTVHLAPPREE